MAKTHLSLSHAAALNAPTGFTVTVRDLRAYRVPAGSSRCVVTCRRCPATGRRRRRSAEGIPRRGAGPDTGARGRRCCGDRGFARGGPDGDGSALRAGRVDAPRRGRRPGRGAARPCRAARRRGRRGLRRVHGGTNGRQRGADHRHPVRARRGRRRGRGPGLARGRRGQSQVTGDAAAGADLAAAAASVGARLVRINTPPGDERIAESAAFAERAAAAARRTDAFEG